MVLQVENIVSEKESDGLLHKDVRVLLLILNGLNAWLFRVNFLVYEPRD
jgi:hypothetical protein